MPKIVGVLLLLAALSALALSVMDSLIDHGAPKDVAGVAILVTAVLSLIVGGVVAWLFL